MRATEASDTAHQPWSQGPQIKHRRRNMARLDTYLMAAEGNKKSPALDRIFAFL